MKRLLRNFISGVLLAAVGGVGLILWLYFHHSDKGPSRLITGFLLFAVIERTWENFFTSKDRESRRIYSDWCLALVTTGYSALLTIVTLDYFIGLTKVAIDVSALGLTMFVSAFSIRWWAIKTLSHQWSIHAIGESRSPLESRFLVKDGPYRYVRHPIYSGIFLEVLSIPLITNSLYGLLFSMVILVPLYGWRAHLEEKTLMQLFGWGYRKYRESTPAFLPVQAPPIDISFDRRQIQRALHTDERRSEDRRMKTDRRRTLVSDR